MPLNRFVLKFRAGNLSKFCGGRHGGPNGDQKHGKNMKIWGQKFRGQNVCFFLEIMVPWYHGTYPLPTPYLPPTYPLPTPYLPPTYPLPTPSLWGGEIVVFP